MTKQENKEAPAKVDSGVTHNPAPRTKRGKLRAKRIKECKEAGMPYNAHDYDTEKG